MATGLSLCQMGATAITQRARVLVGSMAWIVNAAPPTTRSLGNQQRVQQNLSKALQLHLLHPRQPQPCPRSTRSPKRSDHPKGLFDNTPALSDCNTQEMLRAWGVYVRVGGRSFRPGSTFWSATKETWCDTTCATDRCINTNAVYLGIANQYELSEEGRTGPLLGGCYREQNFCPCKKEGPNPC